MSILTKIVESKNSCSLDSASVGIELQEKITDVLNGFQTLVNNQQACIQELPLQTYLMLLPDFDAKKASNPPLRQGSTEEKSKMEKLIQDAIAASTAPDFIVI